DIPGVFRRGDIRHCFADTTRARTLLGWEAKVGLEEGAQELAAWAAGERPVDRTEEANADLRARGILL
ncbi:MAG: nucleoside-diphosphate-sugar epimerase, partial [Actinobacteria bacterium]|nr:nucleoside-diphosphate-sugar epimerase [Actinomycetota bacterium]